MTNLKVLRTAAGSTVSWGLIQELVNSGIEVIGLDAKKQSFAFHLLKKGYVIPKANEPDFYYELLKIVESEKPDAIISGPEPEVLILSKNKEEIQKHGTLVLSPDHESVEICIDKKKMNDAFVQMGIPIPEIYTSIENVKYPCVIKPRFGRGSVGINVVRNLDELKFFLKDFDNYVVQEFIMGKEYSIDVLGDKDGTSLAIVPRIRLETESGVSIKSITVRDDEIIDYCRTIVKDLRLFGPSCIQCIRGEDGVRFLEVNLRFGGGSILAMKADPTIIQNLLRLIKNEETIPSNDFKSGLLMLRYYSEVFIEERVES